MLDLLSRKIMLGVAKNQFIRKIVTKYGMASENGFARRFIAGETLEEAISAIKELNKKGITATLDLLGESVFDKEGAEKARDVIINMFDVIESSGVNSAVSVKLTQLGLDISEKLCKDNMKMILEHAAKYDNFVRIDMESSEYTEKTLNVFKYLYRNVGKNVGIVLQSYLYRTETDVRALNKLGATVRLCKGAYLEPEIVAFQKKKLVDDNYVRCLELLLLEGHMPAIASHDEDIIIKAREIAEKNEISPDKFEFEMLYGIRRDLQEQLVKDGYRMRAYIPFGTEWFPYFSRRLGERMSNVLFILKSMTRE
ncbi:proline dehydrogenase family protein [candidate division KSB1 bacterium]